MPCIGPRALFWPHAVAARRASRASTRARAREGAHDARLTRVRDRTTLRVVDQRHRPAAHRSPFQLHHREPGSGRFTPAGHRVFARKSPRPYPARHARVPSQDRVRLQARARSEPCQAASWTRSTASSTSATSLVRRRTCAPRRPISRPGWSAGEDTLDDLLPEAFAAVKQACKRLCGKTWDVCGIPLTWQIVPYDVQLIGGVMLHEGKIAEMATGEGKTLVATLPMYLNALSRQGRAPGHGERLPRPARQRVDGRDLQVPRAHRRLHPAATWTRRKRREQYACDITYGTNNEFGFDYLRDNMAVRPEYRVQRGFSYAIVDEVDSVLDRRGAHAAHHLRARSRTRGRALRRDEAATSSAWCGSSSAGSPQRWPRPRSCSRTRSKEYEAGVKLLQVQRAAPKHKRFIKLMSDQPGVKKLINRVELEYLRDKRMHELDEDAALYDRREVAQRRPARERAGTLMSPTEPEQFTVPDLTAPAVRARGPRGPGRRAAHRRARPRLPEYGVRERPHPRIQALLKAYSLFEQGRRVRRPGRQGR